MVDNLTADHIGYTVEKEEDMSREFTQYFEKVFENYKKTYQEFMGYTVEEMPSDEDLLTIALNGDTETMLKEMGYKKVGQS